MGFAELAVLFLECVDVVGALHDQIEHVGIDRFLVELQAPSSMARSALRVATPGDNDDLLWSA